MMTGETPDPIARFVFFAVIGCWLMFVLTFALRKRAPKGDVKRHDRTALLGIGLQMAGFFLVWFGPLERKYFSPIVPMPRAAEILIAVVTVGIALASVWMVNAAVRRLGKQWAVAARLVEGHKLITDGPYRFIRNPIYTGLFGMLVATGLAVTRWSALVAAVVLFLVGTYIRVRVEEQLLRGHFGAEFDEYTRRVPAVIPGIW
jgi:protein-S-isoprenylcysteine O-methyltransferase Ste14